MTGDNVTRDVVFLADHGVIPAGTGHGTLLRRYSASPPATNRTTIAMES